MADSYPQFVCTLCMQAIVLDIDLRRLAVVLALRRQEVLGKGMLSDS